MRTAIGPSNTALPEAPQLRLDPGMHTAPINQIDVDADGRYLVSASHDKTVKLWSVSEGRLLHTFWLPQGPGDVGKAYAVAISPDGSIIAAGGWGPSADGFYNSIYLFERQSGRLIKHLDDQPHRVCNLTFAPTGRHLVAALGGANGIRAYDTTSWQVVAADRQYGGASYGATFASDGRFATRSEDGQIRLYDRDFERFAVVKATVGEPFGIAFTPDGGRLAVGYYDITKIDVLDGHSLAPLFQPDVASVDNCNLFNVAWSMDGAVLVAGGGCVKDCAKPLRWWPNGGLGAPQDLGLTANTIMDLRSLADGRLILSPADPALVLLAADGTMLWRQDPVKGDFRNQHDKLKIALDGTSLAFGFEQLGVTPARFDLAQRRLSLNPSEDAALAPAQTSGHGLAIEAWEDCDTPILAGQKLPLEQYEISRSLAIAPNSKHFLLGTEWRLLCFDREGRQLWQRPVPDTVWVVNISRDGRLAVAAYGDGTIRWHRLVDGKELLAFFPHGDRQRWVAWTPEGYYMASPGGEELIGWLINRGLDEAPEFHPVGRFRAQFHRPDVVERVLATLDVAVALAAADAARGIHTRPAPAIVELLPPVIEILSPATGAEVAEERVTLTYRLTGPPAMPMPRLAAYIDGQLVLSQPAPPVAGWQDGYLDQVMLGLRGWTSKSDVKLSLIAEGERSSEPAEIMIRWLSPQPVVTKPQLYVLSIGISRYQRHPPQDLKYAAKDATDIAQLLVAQNGGLYREVHLQLLTDEDATNTSVLEAFAWLHERVTERDVVMLFLSGHGHIEAGRYYFLPHNVRAQTQAHLRVSALDQDVLRSGLQALHLAKAKVVAFLDTCYAGAAFDPAAKGLTTPDMDQLVAELASDETGVLVLSSCTGRQVAHEEDHWQNGAFTEALLEAFAGAAIGGGRGHIRLSDLQSYLPRRVAELTGGKQNPRIQAPMVAVWDTPIAVVR